ncbi:MAG: LAGLIDADG family homing endonuclease [bacterium]|nr:LAGLIDADG family homing endonuclease [Candidatus Wildermuthbacteria bacterium]MDP2664728.1 LAGLIDADG family homing endonuclease [bacterium]
MADTSISKRVQFPKGEQHRFLEKILTRTSVNDAALVCQVSPRTIRDWRRGKFLINLGALIALCKKTRIPFPRSVKLIEQYWYASNGAKRGWEVIKKKYGKIPGDEEARKRKWFEWWERGGKHQKGWIKISQPFSIRRPKFSDRLAEFVGIMLGDGGISKYQLSVTLNAKDEKEYAEFIRLLIKRLFRVPATVSYNTTLYDSTIRLIISRVGLVRYCIQKLGMEAGNKVTHQVDIPDWIKRKKEYSMACIRGLIDTDGTVVIHRYRVNGKLYIYKKLSFTSRSRPLWMSVFNILRDAGFKSRLHGGDEVWLDSQENVKRYFRLIGSSNPKHLMRYGSI